MLSEQTAYRYDTLVYKELDVIYTGRLTKLFINLLIAASVILPLQVSGASGDQVLYSFENGTDGWWVFKSNDASTDLSHDKDGAGNSAGALRAAYKYGAGGSYLGIGVEPKWALKGNDDISGFSGGHLSVWMKSEAGCSARIELRSKNKSTYSFDISKVGSSWGKYSIPFTEFKNKDESINMTGFNLSQFVIIPGKTGSEKKSIWIDDVTFSAGPLSLAAADLKFKLSGKVLADNQPVAAARMSLKGRNGLTNIADGIADSQGVYSLLVTLPGRRFTVEPAEASPEQSTIETAVVAEKQGFATYYKPVILKKGAYRFDVLLSKGGISSELVVVGNRLQTKDGKEVWLQGLCVDSLEWSATGDNILKSVIVAIDQWKANVIRLPVKEEFWYGKTKYQKDGGAHYKQLIDAAVGITASRGAYLVLDLHRFGAPMPEHVQFWKDAAAYYKNNPAVIFELFNEPHGLSWDTWRNGGALDEKENKSADVNAAENTEKNSGKVTTGMQALVDAVRAAGAKNVIIAGGVDWSYDVTGVVNGYALDDRGGNGIVYSSHIYAWKDGWAEKVLVAAEKYPLFVGEVGCQPEPMPWQKSGTEDPKTWAPDVIGLIQKYKLNWTGFSFHPGCGPRAILDWNYTPSPYWGTYVKDALAGKQFELKKMR